MPDAAPVTGPLSLAQRFLATIRAWPWYATVMTLAGRFREDRLALTAGSLTFTTVISLVPLITVMLALFSAFPIFSTLQDTLQRYLIQTLVPDTIAKQLLGLITQFASRASRLGVAGLVALVFSAVAMMFTIDRALNAIWRVRKRRPVAQRVLVYWAAVTLGPLLFGVSLAATSYAVSASRGLLGDMPRGFGMLVGAVEFIVQCVGVASLFHYVPNVYVRWRHAMLGGVFVAVGLAVLKRGVTLYFSAVPTYSMIYGAFASLPIFLVWIFISWIIVLLGAIIAAYAPLIGKQLTHIDEVAGASFRLALIILTRLASARHEPGRGLGSNTLAGEIGVDPLQVDPLLEQLAELDWIGKLEEEGEARYVLLCDPAQTSIEPLVERLLLEPAPDLAAMWQQASFAQTKLADVISI